jgi:acetate kinase
LLGVSGVSADMRVLLASDRPSAAEAIDLFTFRVAREAAAMANTLGGLECLVFTGGIGEHSQDIRLQICNRLRWLGVTMDPSANDQAKQCIGAKTSEVDILIIPTSEETTIARHCSAKLSES